MSDADSTLPAGARSCGAEKRWQRPAFWCALVLIALAGLYQRWAAVGPSSLWMDDVWVAALARFGAPGYILMGDVACAPGYVLALAGMGRMFGWGEATMQFFGIMAGLAQVVAIGWLVGRLTGRRSFGIMAAALLGACPVLAIYSVRLKPYAIDGLLTVGFVWLAVRAEANGSLRRLAVLSLAVLATALFSFPALLTGGILVGIVAIRLALLREKPDRMFPPLALAALHAVATAALYLLVIARHGSSQVNTEYWNDFLLPLTGFREAVVFLWEKGMGFFWGAFPARATWLALFVPVGLVALIRDPRTRGTGVGIALVFAAAFVLSALKIYPVGAGRTDTFSFPLSVLAAVVGMEWIGRRYRVVGPVAAGFSIFVMAVDLATVGYGYPRAPERAVAERLSAMWRPGDGVVLHPLMGAGVAFYGGWPVRIERDPESPIAFVTVPADRDAVVVRETETDVERQLLAMAGASQPRERILYACANRQYVKRDPHDKTIAALRNFGYLETECERFDGGEIFIFCRAMQNQAEQR